MVVAEVEEYTSQIQRLREANQALEKRNSEVSIYLLYTQEKFYLPSSSISPF